MLTGAFEHWDFFVEITTGSILSDFNRVELLYDKKKDFCRVVVLLICCVAGILI
jgi:hypothetical protein